MVRNVYFRAALLLFLWAGLSALLTGCGVRSDFDGPPDRVLFEKAQDAVELQRFDVANLTLQTLVNTYPDSEFAEPARQLLMDPRVEKCGAGWNSSRCAGSRFAADVGPSL